MGPVALVALVHPRGPVVDRRAAGPTVNPASPQLRIQGVQLVRTECARLLGPDERPDMAVQVPLVHHVGAGADVDHLEVAVEELVDGRCGPRITPFVDRVHHPSACRLGSASGLLAWTPCGHAKGVSGQISGHDTPELSLGDA
jgi:hypothetical protein